MIFLKWKNGNTEENILVVSGGVEVKRMFAR